MSGSVSSGEKVADHAASLSATRATIRPTWPAAGCGMVERIVARIAQLWRAGREPAVAARRTGAFSE
ncbi:hypothetical protein WM33_23960 [Burkholderia multivorans]|nr:hypothetical protein WM33_23960 [Burkholderia multivorans]KVZ83731.1 hypothetical protein WL23_08340 [Burkholderia multivorans]